MEGYIKLFRKITDWEWYDDPDVMRLFLHVLLRANYIESKWRGKVIKRGQFVTSLAKLNQETGLSTKRIRTSINKLKRTNELASYTTSEYRILEVINYELYQGEMASEETNEGQINGKQRTNEGQQVKNNKKEKKEKNTDTGKISDEIFAGCSLGFIKKWEEYIKYRKDRKIQALLPVSVIGQIEKLKKQQETVAIAMIQQTIDNGWAGIFPIKDQKKPPSNAFTGRKEYRLPS